jgi:hypothetical protein
VPCAIAVPDLSLDGGKILDLEELRDLGFRTHETGK